MIYNNKWNQRKNHYLINQKGDQIQKNTEIPFQKPLISILARVRKSNVCNEVCTTYFLSRAVLRKKISQGARTAKRVRLIPAELHFKKISEKNGEKKLKKTWQQNCHEVLVAFQV